MIERYSRRFCVLLISFFLGQIVLLFVGIQIYDYYSNDWFFDVVMTPAKAAFPRKCATDMESMEPNDFKLRRSRPQCMKSWVEYDRTSNPTTQGMRLNEFAGRLQEVADEFDRSHNLPIIDRCKLLPNGIFFPYELDIHFPIFTEIFTSFFSLSLLAYDVLGIYYEQCGYSMQRFIIDEKLNWRFWRSPPENHEWVIDIVRIIENRWKSSDIVSPASCAPIQTHPSLFRSSEHINEMEPHNAISPDGVYRISPRRDWVSGDRRWFHHASDALYLSSLVLKQDPCLLQGAADALLSKPLSLLILNRKSDRRITNIDEVLAAVLSISEVDRMESPGASPRTASDSTLAKYPRIVPAVNPSPGEGHPNEFLFEGAPLEMQAQMLHEADIILTPHGAGETNLIWLKPCSIVLEVRVK